MLVTPSTPRWRPAGRQTRPARPPTTSWTAVRRQFGIKKVGHCGTLDPNATGLLVIVLGKGTKLSEQLMSDDKVYEGAIKFGETTDSPTTRTANSRWPRFPCRR